MVRPETAALGLVVTGYLIYKMGPSTIPHPMVPDQTLAAGQAVVDQELVAVRAADGNKYYVLNTDNKHDAANLLSNVRGRAATVVKELANRYHSNPHSIPGKVVNGVKRLIDKTEDGSYINVHELNPGSSPNLAFNRNKGEIIFMCLRQGGEAHGADLADEDVLLYILLHELAHTMTAAYDPKKEDGTTAHSATFMHHERYLYSQATMMGELDPSAQPGKRHCGAIITHPEHTKLPSRRDVA